MVRRPNMSQGLEAHRLESQCHPAIPPFGAPGGTKVQGVHPAVGLLKVPGGFVGREPHRFIVLHRAGGVGQDGAAILRKG